MNSVFSEKISCDLLGWAIKKSKKKYRKKNITENVVDAVDDGLYIVLFYYT